MHLTCNTPGEKGGGGGELYIRTKTCEETEEPTAHLRMSFLSTIYNNSNRYSNSCKMNKQFVILDCRRGWNECFHLLGSCAAQDGFIPTFRDYLSVSTSIIKPDPWIWHRLVVPKRRNQNTVRSTRTLRTEEFINKQFHAAVEQASCAVPGLNPAFRKPPSLTLSASTSFLDPSVEYRVQEELLRKRNLNYPSWTQTYVAPVEHKPSCTFLTAHSICHNVHVTAAVARSVYWLHHKLAKPKYCDSVCGLRKGFHLLRSVQTGYGAHPPSYSRGVPGALHRSKAAGSLS
jgi:hypothetical protein